METEAAILEALRSGNMKDAEQAEFEVFRRYQSQVRAILSRVVGSGGGLDDAVQEAFIDIFRGLSRFDGRSSLGTWIYRVTLRRGWKCAARQKAAREREVGSEAAIENASAPGTRDDLRTREMARRLESALRQLSFEHRSVIALSGLEGLSPEEVAAALGIPVGTVHSRLSRARAKLKELLEAE
jgi:RNA polymerase sigma-70 factor (ECF subfamily)